MHWFWKLDLLSSFLPAAVKLQHEEEYNVCVCGSRNCYLFCLVCFSICMNISRTVHFQFMILQSLFLSLSFCYSFELPYRTLRSSSSETEWEKNGIWNKRVHVQTSQRNEDHISYFFGAAVAALLVFHLCTSPQSHKQVIGCVFALCRGWNPQTSVNRHCHCDCIATQLCLYDRAVNVCSYHLILSVWFFLVVVSSLFALTRCDGVCVTCASMMMYVALESFCQFQATQNSTQTHLHKCVYSRH